MKFLTFRNKEGKTHVANIDKVVRDVSTDDNPVTFASVLDEDELENFAHEKADNFVNSEGEISEDEVDSLKKAVKEQENIDDLNNESGDEKEFWSDVTDEIVSIKENKGFTNTDKAQLLLNLLENFKDGMPDDIKLEIMNTLTSLGGKLEKEKDEEMQSVREEKLMSRIKSLKDKVSSLKEKKESQEELSKSSSSGKSKSSSSESDDYEEQWAYPYSRLIAEAELLS